MHDAVLRDGRSYSGRATILGIPYLAIYEPLRNAQAQTIGILFVGVPLDSAEAFMSRITWEAVIGGLVVALLAGLGYLWTLRANVRPLQSLTGVMHRIADGALDSAVPFATRTDQIGEIARALLQLRDASAHARALEQEATARASDEAEKQAALIGMADTDRGRDDQGNERSRRPHRRHDRDRGGDERLGRADRQFGAERGDRLGAGVGQRADGGKRGRTTQRLDPRDRRPGGAVHRDGRPRRRPPERRPARPSRR